VQEIVPDKCGLCCMGTDTGTMTQAQRDTHRHTTTFEKHIKNRSMV